MEKLDKDNSVKLVIIKQERDQKAVLQKNSKLGIRKSFQGEKTSNNKRKLLKLKRASQLKTRTKRAMMMITMKKNLKNFLTKMMKKKEVINKKKKKNLQQKLKRQKILMGKKVVSQ